ncbi:DUF2924 domain-containing protein [Lysobacter sp. ISL-50]|uniref:DUF2924 domain-containing protein n=1 Tax=unclassified Lysobacter TaxID=2635362 RepID=UPI001BE591F9|nr:DUF2924 domain-containing protein [Lysobacter sp. ISL-42]MBT2750747.1 DUF2924 domain-containing protein [Lysobacter sp. ISL-50]MBT2776106.1 DUF2924 domain-containing protein [Lysobacter sp. ISL-54]MBT2784612.1 DUF2924 domain-containing protein [Lysobacter sp. ISL-52]
MTSTNPTSPHIIAQIESLYDMKWIDLKSLWTERFGSPPGVNNRRYVERRLAHRIQEDAAREAQSVVVVTNEARVRHLLATGTLKPQTKKGLQPGQVITKNYHGVLHTVRVLGKDRFEHNGKLYLSLSAIAREITGTRWSGPLFFGVKPTNASKDSSR